MTVSQEGTETRTLLDLTRLADEVVVPYEERGAYTTKELLMKALESVEVFKKNYSALEAERMDEAYICYTVASKLVSEIIPAAPDFGSLHKSPDMWAFYNDLVDYLVRKRPEYEALRGRIHMAKHGSTNNDNLMLRFQSLRASDSLGSVASPVASPSPGPGPALGPAPPSPERSPSPTRLDAISETNFITVDQMSELLDRYPSRVLVIDFRPKRQFDEDHVCTENIIQLEPVSVRQNYSCKDIQDYSMVTNSDHEKRLFENRPAFDMVVCVDRQSQIGSVAADLTRLQMILQAKPDGKPLKRSPVVLNGGFNEWERIKGPSYIEQTTPSRSGSTSSLVLPEPNYDEKKLIRNVSEYFSTPKGSVAAAPPPIPAPRHNGTTAATTTYQMPTKVASSPSYPASYTRGPAPALPRKPLSRPPTNPLSVSPTRQSQQSLQPVPGALILCGLTNLGNSCYMNAGLQGIMDSNRLVQFFVSGEFKQHINMNSKLGSKGVMAIEFANLCIDMFRHTNQANPTYITPVRFRKAVGKLNPTFNNCQQQDSAEFLSYLLDTLHEDLNENGAHPPFPELTQQEEEARERLPIRIASTIEWERYLKTNLSIIVDLFQGQMMSQLKCLRCGTTSTTYSAFCSLSVPIPEQKRNVTLEDCIDEFVRPEVLDGDDRWNCPHCKSKQRATKRLIISRLPQILIIHLKRFRMDSYLSKINTYVSYGEYVDLTKYWPQPSSPSERESLSKLPVRGQIPPFNYKLFGVVDHVGTLRTGHYTSYMEKSNHGYCLFDDQKIYERRSSKNVINGDAYILFYARE